jgi:hypothetical protein
VQRDGCDDGNGGEFNVNDYVRGSDEKVYDFL